MRDGQSQGGGNYDKEMGKLSRRSEKGKETKGTEGCSWRDGRMGTVTEGWTE